MALQKSLESSFNKEMEDAAGQPPYPPPIDVEYQQGPPPPPPPSQIIFPSYPPPPRRSGVFVPTAFFILFVLVMLFESSILFVYTLVALFNTLPAGIVPINAPINACHCPTTSSPIPSDLINTFVPIELGNPMQTTSAPRQDVTVTVTIMPTTTSSSSSNAAAQSTSEAISAFVSAFTHSTTATHTATTSSSSTSLVIPSLTVETILSSATAPARST